jgi:hypothetical protein
MKELKLQKMFNGFKSKAEDLECEEIVILKGFGGIGCLSSKSVDMVQLYEAYNHYLHYLQCPCYKTIKTALDTVCLQRCSFTMGMNLKLIIHRTTAKSGKRSLVIDQASNDSILMCWQFHNVSFRPLYKGVKT